MPARLNRRDLLSGAACITSLAALWPAACTVAAESPDGVKLGPAAEFSFEALADQAAKRARSPYLAAVSPYRDHLNRIDYDAYQKIKFRPEKSLIIETGQVPVQCFHLAALFAEPVRINLISRGTARELIYNSELFSIPTAHPASSLPDGIGFAGFRVMASDLKTDWLSFLGASYFRTSGPYNQYGLSARGLAINTGLPVAEEFPRFSEFWLEGSSGPGDALTIYASLDGPSVTGAYRIRTERSTDSREVHRIVMEIEAELFARASIERLGIAPFSSMFWYGEASRNRAADWRPEIHDSDGLAILTGSGERIWRPLNNPPRVMTNSFLDRDVRGFGLLQRDRDFVHYLDDGVFYERRASVWVEPLDPWGAGAVHLLEIPTDDEIHDNIAAYWAPDRPFGAGENRHYRYRMSWLDDVEFPETLAFATGTWTGLGGRPGHKRPAGVRKFVIDFQGSVLAGIGRDDGVELVVSAGRGEVSNAYTHPVVDQGKRWRALFDVEAAGPEPVDLRAFLRQGDRALTETWVYQYFPES